MLGGPSVRRRSWLSALDAAAKVLAEIGKPMSCKEMIKAMGVGAVFNRTNYKEVVGRTGRPSNKIKQRQRRKRPNEGGDQDTALRASH